MPLPIILFDSYQKKLLEFQPNQTVKPGMLKMYGCGPTVYNYQSIGNMRAVWLPDTITKTAKIAGWQVEWISNITDVGHLVSDGDEGEDKLEKGAKRENKTVQEIVSFYTQDFKSQCTALNFDLPTGKFNPRASEYAKEQMILALSLVKKNLAYFLEDGIYLDYLAVKKQFEKEKEKLSPQLLEILKTTEKAEKGQDSNFTGRELKLGDKKHPSDFALWKFVGENALQKWRFGDFEEVRKLAEEIKNIYSSDRMDSTKNSPLEGWQPKPDGVDTLPKWKQNSLFPFWNLPKNKSLEPKAKKLRKAGVLSEFLFWQAFKNKKLLGWDIDRQVIIGNYIVDFFIPELGLVVEIDAESHDFKGEYDQERESYLKNLGLEIIHYKDIEIKKSINFVSDSFLMSIKNRVEFLKRSTPSLRGAPQEGNFSTPYHDIENFSSQLPLAQDFNLQSILTKPGCPGWHSECVCMISEISGRQRFSNLEYGTKNTPPAPQEGNSYEIDIHTGGEDHIDIHHKNEILQSEALGFNLSKAWVHNKFVMVDGGKMSKSKGNVYLVKGKKKVTGFDSIQEKGFNLLAYRLMLMDHHYTQQMDFTWDKLRQSQARLDNLKKDVATIRFFAQQKPELTTGEMVIEDKQKQVLLKYLLDNLNTPKFVEKFQELVSETLARINKNQTLNLRNLASIKFWEEEFLQLGLLPKVDPEVLELAQKRLVAKLAKDWNMADKIRDELKQNGWQIDDYSWGFGLWFIGA